MNISELTTEQFPSGELNTSGSLRLKSSNNEEVFIPVDQVKKVKTDIINTLKDFDIGEVPSIKASDTSGSQVNIPLTQENLRKFKKFFEVNLLIDEKEYEYIKKFILETEIPDKNKGLIPELPSSLTKQYLLKNHQKIGLAWLQNCFDLNQNARQFSDLTLNPKWKGVLLADDMGLGKTLQILSFLSWLYESNRIINFKNNNKNRPFLIIAPVILLENWKREYFKFFEPELADPLILHGKTLEKFRTQKGREYYQLTDKDANPQTFLRTDDIAKYKVVITNYDTLTNYEFSLAKIDWSIIILDEAQEIKEPKSYKSRIAKALKADFKLACTGTPIENSLMDLWNIFDFIEPGFLPPSRHFSSIYGDKNMTDELRNKEKIFTY